MNELILHDEKQAKQIARKLAQVPGMTNVKLFRSRHGVEFRLAYDCQATRRDPLQARRHIGRREGHRCRRRDH